VSATGGSLGNPVTFSIDASSTSGACSISGATVRVGGAGTCVIDANQAGSATYSAAPQVQQSFVIGNVASASLKTQAITFISSPPTSPTVGSTYSVSATGGGSGNPVTFSIDASSTSGACSISGATVRVGGAGTCVIDANQAGSATYSAAPQVQQSFVIVPPISENNWTAQGVSQTTLSVSPATVGDLLALWIVNTSTSVTGHLPTSVSGGGVSTWIQAPNTAVSSASGEAGAWWYGLISSTGSSTLTIGGGETNANVRLTAVEFVAGDGYTWRLDTSSGKSNQSTNPASSPSLTPVQSGELAVYGWASSSDPGAGNTSGYTYLNPGWAAHVEIAYNMSTGAATQPMLASGALNYGVAGMLFVPTPGGGTNATALSIRVVGNHLVDSQGTTVRLLGVNAPGMDVLTPPSQCGTFGLSQNLGLFNAPVTWGINAVRVTLNEDCWLGINGVSSAMTVTYQASLEWFVSELNVHGMYAILDLHFSAPGTIPATAQQVMPDADHAPAFWTSLATTFVNNKAVVFDLFNEPAPGAVLPKASDSANWACWLSGCTLPTVYSNFGHQQSSVSWQATGMQRLVNVVRSTGATQPIMLSGLCGGNCLTEWLSHVPADPLNQLVASIHVYNSDSCSTLACWNQQYAPVALQYPVVTAEFGEDDCSDGFMEQYMQFADANGISYLGWSWSPETSCTPQSQDGASLITDWNGDPTPLGIGLQSHLLALAGEVRR
jgi:hypothetical protein